MSKIGALYYMMRLSYEEAIDDYNNKKTDTILSAYKNITKLMLEWKQQIQRQI